jgi:hypothetical protein
MYSERKTETIAGREAEASHRRHGAVTIGRSFTAVRKAGPVPHTIHQAVGQSKRAQGTDIVSRGNLDDELTTTSNYIVSPFVGAIPWPYHFQMNEEEVNEIIEVPVPALLDKNCFHPNTEILNGKTVDSYVYHHQGKIIWGATARILNKFLDIYTRAIPDSQRKEGQ